LKIAQINAQGLLGYSVLNAGDHVVSINGQACCHLKSSKAVVLVQTHAESISIVATGPIRTMGLYYCPHKEEGGKQKEGENYFHGWGSMSDSMDRSLTHYSLTHLQLYTQKHPDLQTYNNNNNNNINKKQAA
jgi:hypothetical protein